MTSALPEDWWTTAEVAAYLQISTSTVRAYLARNQMPPPDRHFGKVGVWRPSTIQEWHVGRPRRGAQEQGEAPSRHRM